MAKKRGRPVKVTPSTSKQHDEHDRSTTESIPLDFETLDDIDFDALSPKQAEKVLTALDELRMKVSAKTLNTKVDEEEARSKDEEEKNKDSSNDGGATLTRADQNENMIDTSKKGPTGVKKQWVVKAKPSQQENQKQEEAKTQTDPDSSETVQNAETNTDAVITKVIDLTKETQKEAYKRVVEEAEWTTVTRSKVHKATVIHGGETSKHPPDG
ncbi:hypothetical protein RIF29_33791 [Crotalaria pallida]|uniref:Uncharacterized protein n=1 Tax=Crotalaria pallida TaxID=3830 RepID=A0AAN9E875_CROPI